MLSSVGDLPTRASSETKLNVNPSTLFVLIFLSHSLGQKALSWDTGQPEPLLVEFVTSGGISPARTLEIGAGIGTNAIWLAERGFDVLGVDVSPLARTGPRQNEGPRSALPLRSFGLSLGDSS